MHKKCFPLLSLFRLRLSLALQGRDRAKSGTMLKLEEASVHFSSLLEGGGEGRSGCLTLPPPPPPQPPPPLSSNPGGYLEGAGRDSTIVPFETRGGALLFRTFSVNIPPGLLTLGWRERRRELWNPLMQKAIRQQEDGGGGGGGGGRGGETLHLLG